MPIGTNSYDVETCRNKLEKVSNDAWKQKYDIPTTRAKSD